MSALEKKSPDGNDYLRCSNFESVEACQCSFMNLTRTNCLPLIESSPELWFFNSTQEQACSHPSIVKRALLKPKKKVVDNIVEDRKVKEIKVAPRKSPIKPVKNAKAKVKAKTATTTTYDCVETTTVDDCDEPTTTDDCVEATTTDDCVESTTTTDDCVESTTTTDDCVETPTTTDDCVETIVEDIDCTDDFFVTTTETVYRRLLQLTNTVTSTETKVIRLWNDGKGGKGGGGPPPAIKTVTTTDKSVSTATRTATTTKVTTTTRITTTTRFNTTTITTQASASLLGILQRLGLQTLSLPRPTVTNLARVLVAEHVVLEKRQEEDQHTTHFSLEAQSGAAAYNPWHIVAAGIISFALYFI